MNILNDMLITMAVTVGGAAFLAAFLWLATFPRHNIQIVGGTWLTAGLFCAFFYLALATRFALSNPIVMFLNAAIIGLPLFMFLRFWEPTNKRFRWWGLYVIWLYAWITTLIGGRDGLFGLLAITLPATFIAGLGLFFVAGFLLPFPKLDLYRDKRAAPLAGGVPTFREEILDFVDLFRYPQNKEARKQWFDQRRQAFHCLVSFALGTNRPYYAVIDEKITERTEGIATWLPEEEKLIRRTAGDLFGDLLAGPGIILTGCDHAVVLSTGQRFKGAKGPGIILTGYGDHPTRVIDLRVQLCAFPVEARTKDGIDVKVTVFTPFQINTGNERPELGKSFPYRAGDVFKAIHAELVEHVGLSQTPESLKQLKWYDLPQLAGERIVREIISRYEFDELYAPFELHTDPNRDPRAKIAAELREQLEEILPTWGLQRVGSGISNLTPTDERVIEQRIEAWRAEWARQIMLQQAAGQSKRIRMAEQARAQAQIDIILSIGRRIEQLREAEGHVPLDAIMLYFVEVLEELAGKSALRRLLPGDITGLIQRIRGTVGQGLAKVEGG